MKFLKGHPMLLRVLAIFVWVVGSSNGLLALTASECREILTTYNVTLDECAPTLSSNTLRTTFPTDYPTGTLAENHVFFPGGGEQLDASARAQLAALARILKGQVMGRSCLHLIGHSDSSGGTNANQTIALRRANNVMQELLRLNVARARIEQVSSMGETRPLAALSDLSKWQRRVEIRARTCPQKSSSR
ncbi:OmpA family protein [Cognatishimia activa]|nr:OmpA family protein [Cognatishimia activa]MEE2945142.1 OmpA family protein [Pseudomonadota bacterium]